MLGGGRVRRRRDDGAVSRGKLAEQHVEQQRAIPAGLCVSRDGKTLYVANVWGHRITKVDLDTQEVAGEILIGTNALVTIDPKKEATEDEAALTKRAEAVLDKTESADPFPYACTLDEKRKRLYVTLWAQAAVANRSKPKNRRI